INVEKPLIDAIMIRDGVNYVEGLKTYLEENLIMGVFQLAEPEYEIPMYWMTVGDMYEKCVDNPKVVALRIETYPPFKFRYEFNKSHIGNDEEDILIAELRFLTELDFETTIPIFTDKGVVY